MSRNGRLEEIPIERRVESFADDLNTRLGIVSGRVALLPRSTEIQPKSLRFGPLPRLRPGGSNACALRPGNCVRVSCVRGVVWGKKTPVRGTFEKSRIAL